MLERSRAVLDMAVAHGTIAVRAHPDVDPIQGLLGVETALTLREEYRDLLDLDVVAFPQEGIVKAPGTARADGGGAAAWAPTSSAAARTTSARGRTRRRHIDTVFELARRFDAPVDMHADFADDASDPRYAAAGYIAEKTIEHGFEGRVSLGHVTSLASLTREEAAPVIERLRDARISIVTLPATDVYLGGRGDERNQRRGVTPVHLLRDSGVNVTFSSNNVRNAFTPFGKADMLQIGNLLAHVAQFGTPHSQAEILRMATYDAARSIGLDDYGLAEGRRADLVVCDSPRRRRRPGRHPAAAVGRAAGPGDRRDPARDDHPPDRTGPRSLRRRPRGFRHHATALHPRRADARGRPARRPSAARAG